MAGALLISPTIFSFAPAGLIRSLRAPRLAMIAMPCLRGNVNGPRDWSCEWYRLSLPEQGQAYTVDEKPVLRKDPKLQGNTACAETQKQHHVPRYYLVEIPRACDISLSPFRQNGPCECAPKS
jgi:hypothetical protein